MGGNTKCCFKAGVQRFCETLFHKKIAAEPPEIRIIGKRSLGLRSFTESIFIALCFSRLLQFRYEFFCPWLFDLFPVSFLHSEQIPSSKLFYIDYRDNILRAVDLCRQFSYFSGLTLSGPTQQVNPDYYT